MNQERQKTDAIADAVEIKNNAPAHATHYRDDPPEVLYYYFKDNVLMVACKHGDFISRSPIAMDRLKPL